tara:strand:- start:499 stop:1074 length:576 start_codon:yes stop_codon:yes gene_type:complete
MNDKKLYRIINLASGDNIIGKVTKKESTSITIYRPYQMKIITLMDPVSDAHAFRQEALVMRNWLELSEEEQVTIPLKQVIAITSPTDRVTMHYNEEMEKEDNPTFMEDLLDKLKEEGINPEEISEEEFIENSTISIDPEHIKDIIEKIINEGQHLSNLEGFLKDDEEEYEGPHEEDGEEYFDTDKDMYGWE